jgi:hypothetical protein
MIVQTTRARIHTPVKVDEEFLRIERFGLGFVFLHKDVSPRLRPMDTVAYTSEAPASGSFADVIRRSVLTEPKINIEHDSLFKNSTPP